MSFSVQVTPDLIPLEPGATTPVSIVVINKGEEPDKYELEIEGVDPEWTAVPVPVFGAEPGETHTERVFFKPARSSESLAGNYPFVVRIRSLISGEAKTVQAVIEVKPFNHVTMEITPKKGSFSAWKKRNTFTAVLVNLGNTEHTMCLLGSDPEDSCAYEFDTEQITLAAGQQKEVEFVATPTSKPFFAGGRLIGFSVTARGVDKPSVATSAQAQLEHRPFITPTGLILTFIVALIIFLWLLMKPQPLQIVSFSVTPASPVKGQTVNVSWTTSQAQHVKVMAGTEVLADGADNNGRVPYPIAAAGTIDFKIIATKDGADKVQDVLVTVKDVPADPEPTIDALAAKPTRVKLGSTFELDYTLGPSVTKATLEPNNLQLDTTLSRIDVTTNKLGDQEYTVVASNKDGKTVSRTVKVSVYEESDATIIAFSPSNTSVPLSVGRVTLSWQVSGAVRVELSSSTGTTQQVDPSTSMDIPLTAKTTFTLTAYDSKGRKASQSRVVDVVPDAPPTDPNGPPPTTPPIGGPGGGTGGATTAGGGTR